MVAAAAFPSLCLKSIRPFCVRQSFQSVKGRREQWGNMECSLRLMSAECAALPLYRVPPRRCARPFDASATALSNRMRCILPFPSPLAVPLLFIRSSGFAVSVDCRLYGGASAPNFAFQLAVASALTVHAAASDVGGSEQLPTSPRVSGPIMPAVHPPAPVLVAPAPLAAGVGLGTQRSTLLIPISVAASTSRATTDEGTLESIIGGASTSGGGTDEAPSTLLDQTVLARQAISPWLKFRDQRLERSYQMDYFAKVSS